MEEGAVAAPAGPSGGGKFTAAALIPRFWDVENETAVQEALSRLVRDKTVLIIAHRMRTVAGAGAPRHC